ncbi:hypothetical protein AYJ08_05805 [Brevibacillus sp. SKDU10]|uniref:hypothetical protein n=1 Tax=Brevibacillus sp. SKDU10 TaxID=1247872 RepID=UPI0007C9413E|nr:hypothetical protein [Brevibacillus sp. SKDU10]OAJ75131.1 hypothetical protein AYJ08_05805 [Brevibacillus sp. SKDU10]
MNLTDYRLRITPRVCQEVAKITRRPAEKVHSWIAHIIRKATMIDDGLYEYHGIQFRVRQVSPVQVVVESASGTYEPTINVPDGCVSVGNVFVRKHAIQRARERFGIETESAAQWLADKFAQSTFVANTKDSKGNIGRLFSCDGISIYVDIGRDIIRTVFPGAISCPNLYRKFSEIVSKEIRKIDRSIRAAERKAMLTKAQLNCEKSALELRMLKTRSVAVKLACQARINAINEYFTQLDADIEQLIARKKFVAKSVVAYARATAG